MSTPILEVSAIAIGFNGLDAGNNTGTIWVDDIGLAGSITENGPESLEKDETSEPGGGVRMPCTGGAVIPLALLGYLVITRIKKQN